MSDDEARRLAAAGWRVRKLDQVDSKESFHRQIAAALELPHYYGANLDALWDCLFDLPGPTALLWSGWSEFARNDPDYFKRVTDLLADRAEEQPAFLVRLLPEGQPVSGRPRS